MAEKTPTRSGTMKGEPMKDIAARELKGHNILAVERFWDSTFWMIEFTVLRPTAYGEILSQGIADQGHFIQITLFFL